MTDPAPNDGRSSAARALAILGAFDENHSSLSLTEIAKRAAVPLSTAHRLVRELTEWGALARRQKSYVLGRRIAELGYIAPDERLRRTALPHLVDLQATLRQPVHLAIRDGIHIVFLERLTSTSSIPIGNTVGFKRPLYHTGTGKILLAYAPVAVQERVLSRLFQITPYTITRPHQLARELEAARESGYAISSQEGRIGVCSIGVPIFADGAVIGTIGAVVPTLRTKDQVIARLRDVSRKITASLTSNAGLDLDTPVPDTRPTEHYRTDVTMNDRAPLRT